MLQGECRDKKKVVDDVGWEEGKLCFFGFAEDFTAVVLRRHHVLEDAHCFVCAPRGDVVEEMWAVFWGERCGTGANTCITYDGTIDDSKVGKKWVFGGHAI